MTGVSRGGEPVLRCSLTSTFSLLVRAPRSGRSPRVLTRWRPLCNYPASVRPAQPPQTGPRGIGRRGPPHENTRRCQTLPGPAPCAGPAKVKCTGLVSAPVSTGPGPDLGPVSGQQGRANVAMCAAHRCVRHTRRTIGDSRFVRLLLYQLQIPLRSPNDQFKVNLYNKG